MMRTHGALVVAFTLAAAACGLDRAAASPTIGGCPVFPPDNVWNVPVDKLPVHPDSDAWVDTIGADKPLWPDFGSALYEGAPIGIPYTVVPFRSPRVEIIFAPFDGEGPYEDESDAGPAPIPPDATVEGGPSSVDDRHVLVVEDGSCTLFELYKAVPNPDGTWSAVASVRFDLEGNDLRPAGWTSSDAAGLPVFPGLVRQDEVAAGEIAHALRFTVPRTGEGYVWPGRHDTSDHEDPALPGLGQRFRLKADVDISGFSPANQVILRALKTYGMMLADNGSPWFLSGAPSGLWDDEDLAALHAITGSDFEAVDVSGLIIDSDSGEASAR